MTSMRFGESIEIARTPQQVWDLITAIDRTGEWSPICVGATWDDPTAGPVVGAQFTGHNAVPGRTWDTRCRVVAADPGREFAWVVNDGWVRWGYRLHPVEGGTELTETWDFTQVGQAGVRERWGEQGDEQVALRRKWAVEGIPATLTAIKGIAEA